MCVGHLFTPDQCNDLLRTMDRGDWHHGELAGGDPDLSAKGSYRIAMQQSVTLQGDSPLVQAIYSVSGINSNYHRFDLSGVVQTDPLLLLKYSSDEGARYNWHMDVGPTNPTRKLSFTIQLSSPSEYSGGNLEFMPEHGFDQEAIRQQGTLIVFPAFRLHRVTPVTSGTRYALIGWLHGNSFR